MLGRLAPAAAAVALAAVAVPAAAHASPGIGEPTSFTAAFTTRLAGHQSGLKLETTGKPPVAPTTEAPAVRQTVVLPRGTRLDLSRLPRCDADAAAIAAMGAEVACPTGTRLGSGRAEGLANGAPVVFDLSAYAIGGRLYFAGSRDGVPLKTGFEGVAKGRRIALTVPTANGAIAPTLFRARIDAAGGWLRTPRSCPHSGHWTARGVFQGLSAIDGAPLGDSRTLTDALACRHG
jgi:hypothetical protein